MDILGYRTMYSTPSEHMRYICYICLQTSTIEPLSKGIWIIGILTCFHHLLNSVIVRVHKPINHLTILCEFQCLRHTDIVVIVECGRCGIKNLSCQLCLSLTHISQRTIERIDDGYMCAKHVHGLVQNLACSFNIVLTIVNSEVTLLIVQRSVNVEIHG